MRTALIILAALVCLVPLGMGGSTQSRHLLAVSKNYGAEVFVSGTDEGWCAESVAIDITLSKDSPMREQGPSEFFSKVGLVLGAECPLAQRATIRMFDAVDGDYLYLAEAKQQAAWALVPATPNIQDIKGLLSYAYGQRLESLRQSLGLQTRSAAKALIMALISVFALIAWIMGRGNKTEALHTESATPRKPQQPIAAVPDIDTPEATTFTARAISAQSPAPPEAAIVCSASYRERLDKALQGPKALWDAEKAGEWGEAQVLKVLQPIGGGLVYWGLAMGLNDQDFEADALVVAPHSLLFIEVKNYRGTCRPVLDAEKAAGGHAWHWFRPEDGKTLKSPVNQIGRSRNLLAKAVTEIVGQHIPVVSVVVMVNDSFRLEGPEDDRARVMALGDFKSFYADFAQVMQGQASIAKRDLAALVAQFARHGQMPAFYDAALFPSLTESMPDAPLSEEAHDDTLYSLLRKDWGMLANRAGTPKQIWIGSTGDLKAKYNNSK